MKCDIAIPIITEFSVKEWIFFFKIRKQNGTVKHSYNKHTLYNESCLERS
eukprot:GAHX01004622.1.p1 GENE.GAHX01004622.1~~GAHX01004622.1.p1  ORF type:complete len:50 (+),score=0.06 GAHX01004622.1:60-209(+)